MKKLALAFMTWLFSMALAQANTIPYLTSPATNEASQINATLNALITAINTAITTTDSYGNPRNLLDNPKFDVYPIGVGNVYTSAAISTTLTGINTTATYHAGRWAAYANNGAASVQVANVTAGLPPTFVNAEQVGRTAGSASTTQVCLVQEVPGEKVQELQGQAVVLSYYALAGANFSGTNLQVYINTGTTVDQGLATLISAAPATINSWAGATNPLTALTQAVTTSWTRYTTATVTIPVNANEAAVQICYTPVGTAGAADNIQLTGIQFEASTLATTFEYRPLLVEALAVGRRVQGLLDQAATRYNPGACVVSATATDSFCSVPLPVAMTANPTTVVQTAASFAVSTLADPPVAQNCTTLSAVATATTPTSIGLKCTVAAGLTASTPALFMGQNTGKAILVFNDF